MVTSKTIRSSVAAAAAALLLAACGSNDIYNTFVHMPEDGWSADSLAVFRVDIDDATVPYDLWMQVRNHPDYAYGNLWLFVNIISPDGSRTTDTLECILARPDGRWLGEGWGSYYTLQCPYRAGARFAQPGRYIFRAQHGMRADDIRGIEAVGLRVCPSEQPKARTAQ